MYDAVAKGFERLGPEPDDVMTWINADDRLVPGALNTIASAVRDLPQIDLASGLVAIIDEGGSIRSITTPSPCSRSCLKDGLHDGRILPIIHQEGTFWRARLWHKAGGVDRTFRLAGDWDLWRRFAAEADHVMLDTLTAMHRRSPHQLSSDTAGYYREVDQRLSEVMAESHTAIETLLRWYRQGADISSPPYVGQVAQRHTRGWKLATQPCRPPTFNNVEGTHWQGTFDFADGEWLTVSGFGGVEGPFPKQGIHATVRWTTEAKAILRLYSSRSGPRRLAFEFTTLVRGQTVEISAEGEVLAQEVLSGGLKTVNRIVVEGDLGQGWCHIAIKVDRMRKTPDGRTVGVMIRSIELENAEKPITRAVDRTKQAIRPLGDP